MISPHGDSYLCSNRGGCDGVSDGGVGSGGVGSGGVGSGGAGSGAAGAGNVSMSAYNLLSI